MFKYALITFLDDFIDVTSSCVGLYLGCVKEEHIKEKVKHIKVNKSNIK
jgi:hypothetical protein